MFEVRLVGATQVHTPSHIVEGRDFGGTKPRQLLELLALHAGSPVSKERLADLLWDGEPPTSYVGTLEGYVSLLRGRLQPGVPARSSVLRTVQGGYQLDAEQVRVDTQTVRELVARARTARAGEALTLLRQALDLGAGELLPGAEGVGWADTARQHHDRLMAEAGTHAAQHALQLGELDLAATLADGALALDPLAEEACRCAMRALWAAGRTAEALRRHADLRRVLADELGVDPSPETQTLMGQLLRDETPPVVPFQRRRTDLPLTVAGAPGRQVDVLAGALVAALRRTSVEVVEGEEDPELISKLEDVLRHLRPASEQPVMARRAG